jgi:hypothetical protein
VRTALKVTAGQPGIFSLGVPGVRIEVEGPFGAIEPVEYVISVDDLDGSRAAPPGNLHAVAAELHELTKATKELNEIIRSASLEPA